MFFKTQAMELVPKKLLNWQIKQDSNQFIFNRLSYDNSLINIYFHYLEIKYVGEEQKISIIGDIGTIFKTYGLKQSIYYFYHLKTLIEKANSFQPIEINPKALDIIVFVSIELQKKNAFSEIFEDAVYTFYISRKVKGQIQLTDCDVNLLRNYQKRLAAAPVQVVMRAYFFDRIKYVYAKLWNLPKDESKNVLFIAIAPVTFLALLFSPTLRKNFVNNLTIEEQIKIIGGFFLFCWLSL